MPNTTIAPFLVPKQGTQISEMGRPVLHSARVAFKGGANAITAAGVCMAMAMAVSTKTAVAFSTTASKTAAIAPHAFQQKASPSPFHSIDANHPWSLQFQSSRRSQRLFATAKNTDEDCGCDTASTIPLPQGESQDDLLETGTLLKETFLTNIEGNRVKLGNYLSDDPNDATIVVFLRHLA